MYTGAGAGGEAVKGGPRLCRAGAAAEYRDEVWGVTGEYCDECEGWARGAVSEEYGWYEGWVGAVAGVR